MDIDIPVSVTMSVYNGERFLSESIDSILGQTFKNYEFIIINDGSTDKSGEILQNYVDKDTRIILIEQSNKGLTYSLNKGISLARGKYIARMDADDISLPERLEYEYNLLESDARSVLAACYYEIMDENGIKVRDVRMPKRNITYFLLHNNRLCHSSVMFSKRLFDKLGGYRDVFKYSQDYDLWLRMMEYGKIFIVNKVLHKYRFYSSSISIKKRNEQAFYAYLARKCFSIRKENKQDENNFVDNMIKKISNIDSSFIPLSQAYIPEALFMLDLGEIKKAREIFIKIIRLSKCKNLKALFYLFLTFFPRNVVYEVRKIISRISEIC